MNKIIFIITIFVTSITYGLDIPEEHRVKNIGDYCTWCSFDTIARANSIEPLIGVMEDRYKAKNGASDAGYDEVIIEELNKRKVDFKLYKQWSFNRELLEKYSNKYGVAVALKDGNPWSGGWSLRWAQYGNGRWYQYWHPWGCHMIVVTFYDDEWVYFYDSNKTWKIWKCSRSWFDTYWLGNSVCVFPKE